jgi:hypothetical protein
MRRMLAVTATAGLAAGLLVIGAAQPVSAGAPIVEVTITKTVVGTDPGVAFPIVLTCEAQDVSEGSDAQATPQIPDAGDGPLVQTVNLKGGESTTLPIQLPQAEPLSVTCAATEDPAAAPLPDGYSCTAAVTPESAFVYTSIDGIQDAAFTVTNTCVLEVAAITFTG